MQLCWLAVLGCLSVQLVTALPVADPTQDTLVISRVDETSTEPELAPTTELTTDEPNLPIKLTEMTVNSLVSLRYVHTAVVARVKNPAKKAQEANFRVLLPETAFISGFVMTLDGKSYKAYVKEKEEAKQIYDQAVSQGLGAAHVTAKARDSNQFVVSVNVEPATTAIFNLTYEELLVRRNGVYNHAINLHPGALVPKLSVTVHIKEAQKITDLRVPEIRTGNEIDATKDDAQNSKAVIERGHDDREATITFSPDLDEQKRLMEIYADKSKESISNTNRWYSNQQEEDKTKNEGVLGQFVVQYDVERPKDGEILVNEGYFVHFFAPTSLPPLPKYAVFVLDTSGSMMDRKIIQLREAMQTILSDLNPGDYFSIVEFASSVTIHELKEADQEPPKQMYYYSDFDKKPTLVPPSPATPENIAKAKVIISRLDAAGGTNIASALDVAVNLIHKRTEWGKKTPKTNETTDVSTTEAAVVDSKYAELYDIEKMKTLEPIIIFLTDGDPTVGETNPTTVINRLTEKNFGEDKATIFSLAFGEDADRKFLRKLSLRNDGFMRHIYEAADAALQLQDFYRQVSSPLLADVKFIYPENQVKEGSLTKNKFRTFYAGSEVVVAGQVTPEATEITPQVLGFCGVRDGVGRERYEKLPKAPVPLERQYYLPLERLWSYLTIKQLLDEKDATDGVDADKDDKKSPEKKALALALKYEFVTPLTSLVVVKPNATKAVDAESVDKPVNQPYYGQSQSFGAPLSINSGYSHYPSAPGFAYASVQSVGYPGAAGQIAPAFTSQAFSYDSFVQEEAEVDDYPDLGAHEPVPGPEPVGGRPADRLLPLMPTYKGTRPPPSAVSMWARPANRNNLFVQDGGVPSAPFIPGRPVDFHSLPWPPYRGTGAPSAPIAPTGGPPVPVGSLPPPFDGVSGVSTGPDVPGRTVDFHSLSGSFYRGRGGPSAPLTPTGSQTVPVASLPPPFDGGLTSGIFRDRTGDFGFRGDGGVFDDDDVSTTMLVESATPSLVTIEDYHLQGYDWVEPLLNTTADAIVLQVNGTDVFLELTKQADAPRSSTGDAPCAASVTGEAGVCVYLTRCHAAKTITTDVYRSTYCSVEGHAGVCCSAPEADEPKLTSTTTSSSVV